VKDVSVSPLMIELATYIARAVKKLLPKAVVEKTKHHVLDTLAAMVSGSRLPPGRRAISYGKTLGGTKEATVIGSRFLTNTITAALVNGILAHADETDDSHAPSLTHPGCGIVPAAWAMGEHVHANGTQLLRAVALGYDIGCRLTLSLNPYEFRQDGHSTHSFGPMFGAAAAASALAGLNPDQVRHALSYTAQQASAWPAGCATRSTSKRRSTSAACRRATAPRRRVWSRMASRRSRMSSRGTQLFCRLRPQARPAGTHP